MKRNMRTGCVARLWLVHGDIWEVAVHGATVTGKRAPWRIPSVRPPLDAAAAVVCDEATGNGPNVTGVDWVKVDGHNAYMGYRAVAS